MIISLYSWKWCSLRFYKASGNVAEVAINRTTLHYIMLLFIGLTWKISGRKPTTNIMSFIVRRDLKKWDLKIILGTLLVNSSILLSTLLVYSSILLGTLLVNSSILLSTLLVYSSILLGTLLVYSSILLSTLLVYSSILLGTLLV